MLVDCLIYSSVLKMEDACSCETSVDPQPNTRRYIPEDRPLECIELESLDGTILGLYHYCSFCFPYY
jgi:hypothetical protein